MRAITRDSVSAFLSAKKFKGNNTTVEVLPNVTVLKLFGNEIAYKYNDHKGTLSITNCGYFTVTTKERLNGLPNVSINQSKGIWYLNGEAWNGKLTDING